MADERGFDEDEVEQIFDLAVQGEPRDLRSPASDQGMTLREIQEIGREAGIEPERIAEAASIVVARRGAQTARTSMGLPITAGRVVALPRAPTDHEWELFVVELRETFSARGRIRSHGALREWSNGNLHAVVEPTPTGYRLRLATLKGGAVARGWMGVAGLAAGVILFPLAYLTGGDLTFPIASAGVGGAFLALNRFLLPRWALERERQMEYLAGRITALLGSGAG